MWPGTVEQDAGGRRTRHRHPGGAATWLTGPAVGRGFCARAEVLAEPLPHLLDRLVHLGYPPRTQDERVLSLGHRVDLGGDLEVRESAAELGAGCAG
ncbi:hypothetical protein [Streptomyces sp. NBC_00076]|uniref:hypothetical protein n=1 Tax=Streptomyces sp. NBC_00076 TaxID=2975642 RepID=UPI003247B0A0